MQFELQHSFSSDEDDTRQRYRRMSFEQPAYPGLRSSVKYATKDSVDKAGHDLPSIAPLNHTSSTNPPPSNTSNTMKSLVNTLAAGVSGSELNAQSESNDSLDTVPSLSLCTSPHTTATSPAVAFLDLQGSGVVAEPKHHSTADQARRTKSKGQSRLDLHVTIAPIPSLRPTVNSYATAATPYNSFASILSSPITISSSNCLSPKPTRPALVYNSGSVSSISTIGTFSSGASVGYKQLERMESIDIVDVFEGEVRGQ